MVDGLKCTNICKLKDCDNQADDDDSIMDFKKNTKNINIRKTILT